MLRLVTRVVFVADAEALTHGHLVWSLNTLCIFISFFYTTVKEFIKPMSLLGSRSADLSADGKVDSSQRIQEEILTHSVHYFSCFGQLSLPVFSKKLFCNPPTPRSHFYVESDLISVLPNAL